LFQDKIKQFHDKKVKEDDFKIQDLVLKWESKFEGKEKHGKFDHLWRGFTKLLLLDVIMFSFWKL